MMLRKVLILFTLSVGIHAGEMPVVGTMQDALSIAGKEGRTIILNFTGKEWCPACIHLRTKIFASDEFKAAAGDKYVEVEVIFPRRPDAVQALGEERLAANERLLNEYHITTGMPTMVLHDEQGMPFAVVVGTRRTPADFLQALDAAQALRVKRDAAFAAAEGKKGMERARALAAGLNVLPTNCRSKYDAVVEEINAADTENTLGYKYVLIAPKLYADQVKKFHSITASFACRCRPEELREQLGALQEFMKSTPDMQPEVAQMVLRAESDVYALLGEFEKMTEYMRRALEAAPNSDLAPRLRTNLEYMEKNILPHAQELRERAMRSRRR